MNKFNVVTSGDTPNKGAGGQDSGVGTQAVQVIGRDRHSVSRANISPNALKVLYRLKDAGFRACLVGGGVRDLLLGREPKDFDVATDAHPEEIRRLFRNCRLIGRRFRLAHVLFGREIIEVATFRGEHHAAAVAGEHGLVDEDGRIMRDNVYGSIEEDARRRDFTINALYYDIKDFSVLDYAGGMDDLQNGLLRVIGDAEARYREDPVRMLRAVRFAAKLGFRLHADTEAPIFELADLLEQISPARLFDEVIKLFLGGSALNTFELLRHYDLFRPLFPYTEAALGEEPDGFPQLVVARALENTDARIDAGKPVTPAFLYAALLWPAVHRRALELGCPEMDDIAVLQAAGREVGAEQHANTTIPKRFSQPMREIWNMQPRFLVRQGKRPMRLLSHPRFRAGYDFLLLRGASGEVDQEICDWWTEFQSLSESDQHQKVGKGSGARKRRRRRRRRNPANGAGESAPKPE